MPRPLIHIHMSTTEDHNKDQGREYVCSTWFERDRKHIRLEMPNGKKVFELWDAAVDEAIESGYLTPPRIPRATNLDWHRAAVSYARSLELIS